MLDGFLNLIPDLSQETLDSLTETTDAATDAAITLLQDVKETIDDVLEILFSSTAAAEPPAAF